MARGPRLELVGVPLHVIQRGNNRAACFTCDDDRRLYLYYLRHAAVRFGCAVHAYVLMTNHVHLLVTPREHHAVSRLMQQVGRRYVRKFNESHDRTGTLWEGRFRSSLIDSERYFLVCQRYIEHNPVRAGMVRDALDYAWSSHRHYAAGLGDPLIAQHECYQRLGTTPAERRAAYAEICAATLADYEIESIRACLNKGQPLGSETFRTQVGAQALDKAHRQRRRRAALALDPTLANQPGLVA